MSQDSDILQLLRNHGGLIFDDDSGIAAPELEKLCRYLESVLSMLPARPSPQRKPEPDWWWIWSSMPVGLRDGASGTSEKQVQWFRSQVMQWADSGVPHQLAELRAELRFNEERRSDLNAVVTRLRAELDRDRESWATQRHALCGELRVLQAKLTDALGQRDTARKELDMNATVARLRAKLTAALADRDTAREALTLEKARLDPLVAEMPAKLAEALADRDAARTERDDARKALACHREGLASLIAESNRCAAVLDSVKAERDELLSQMRGLQAWSKPDQLQDANLKITRLRLELASSRSILHARLANRIASTRHYPSGDIAEAVLEELFGGP